VDVLGRWAETIRRPEAEVPLDEAALLISACAQPQLDVDAQLHRLDRLAEGIGAADTASVCHLLFDQLGLRGDRDGYDEPANSYLDRVLDRRLGIPISLSVLLVEIGRRCGVRLEPVGMPGHFLVRDPADPEALLDPFDRGRRLDRAGAEQLLRLTTGEDARLTPEKLATTGTHTILARMLANLDRSFERRRDRASLAWVCDLRLELPQAALGDRLQLAMRLGALGRFHVAATVLEETATVQPEETRDRLLREALSLRARLN
jgi:regulator of sirC expression with transglutaminase-like and TPR domain